MKKLVKAVIINFQSHKYTEVLFGNLTVIVGPSDSGKSAIIRAIKWCLYNEPSGLDFLRIGEEFVEVALYFNDGTIIKRRKGEGDFYELTNIDGQTIHLESFGVGPVDEVVNFHGMKKVNFLGEKQSLNISEQLSEPFFIAQTSGERANIIGKIANVEAVDIAIQDTNAEIREKEAIEKKLKAELKENNIKLAQYIDLPQMEFDLVDVKRLKSEMEVISANINKIKTLKSTLTKLFCDKYRLETLLSAEEEVSISLSTIDEMISSIHKTDVTRLSGGKLKSSYLQKVSLEKTINKAPIEEIEQCINNLSQALEGVRNISTTKTAQNKLIRELEKQEKVKYLVAGEEDVAEVLSEIEFCQQRLTDILSTRNKAQSLNNLAIRKNNGDKVISNLEHEYTESLNQYKNKLLENPTCPFCMSEIDANKIKSIEDIV